MFAEIRKLDRMSMVRDFNLFPETQNLLILERKYGDSLSFEDLHGYRLKKNRRCTTSSITVKSEFETSTERAKTDILS